MANVVWGVLRDLYIVLLVIFLIEQIPGNDLLHDTTRKGIVTITIIVVAAKLMQPCWEQGGGGGPGRAPIRDKKVERGKDGYLEWSSAEMQGWRPAMEDATCIVPSLAAPLSNYALFAVFDGHGGSQVSRIASKEFPKVLAACAAKVAESAGDDSDEANESIQEEYLHGAGAPAAKDSKQNGEGDHDASGGPLHIGKSLHLAMLTMDSFLRQGGNGKLAATPAAMPPESRRLLETNGDKRNAFNLVGSTAIVVLVECSPPAAPAAPAGREGEDASDAAASAAASASDALGRPRRVCVANCGDSRAILCRKGKAVELSEDHKPELKKEEDRINKAGGHVAMIGPCHRVDGWGLNLSRALGDFYYKQRSDLPPEQQKVIAVPEIQTLELTEDDEFLVLGCDGVFELNTSQKVVNIVRQGLEAGMSVEKAAEELLDKSCSSNLMKTRGKGGDNCSAIVVRLAS